MADVSTATKPTAYDPTGEIAQLKAAQKSAMASQLASQKASTVSALNAEKQNLAYDSQSKRENASTTSQLGARNFAEFMASRGQNNAVGMNGTNAQAEISRQGALQGAYSGINLNEIRGNQDIDRRMTDAENAYQQGITSSDASAEAQAMQLLMQARQNQYTSDLAQYNTDLNRSYTQNRDTVADNRYNTETAYNQGRDTVADNRYNSQTAYAQGRDTIADNRYNTEYSDKQKQYNAEFNRQTELDKLNKAKYIADATGMYNPYYNVDVTNEVNPYMGNLQAEINRRMGTPDKTDDALIPQLEAARFNKIASDPQLMQQYGGAYKTLQGRQVESGLQNDAMQRVGLDISNKLNQLKLESYPEEQQIAIESAKNALESGKADLAAKIIQNSNLDAKLKADIAGTYANINQGWAQVGIQQQNANTNAGQLGLEETKYNDSKSGGIDPKTIDGLYDDSAKYIDSMYTSKGEDRQTMSMQDKKDIATYIQNMEKSGTPKPVIDRLLMRYGLSSGNRK